MRFAAIRAIFCVSWPRENTRPGLMGRPSKYRPKLAREIVERLAGGESLRSICRLPYMPDERTVRRWKDDGVDQAFTQEFEEARECQAHRWFEEIIELADESKQATTMHEVQSYRLRMDARRWAASRILPDHYGDRLEVAHHGRQQNVVIFLPSNDLTGTDEDDCRVIDGTARELESDGTD